MDIRHDDVGALTAEAEQRADLARSIDDFHRILQCPLFAFIVRAAARESLAFFGEVQRALATTHLDGLEAGAALVQVHGDVQTLIDAVCPIFRRMWEVDAKGPFEFTFRVGEDDRCTIKLSVGETKEALRLYQAFDDDAGLGLGGARLLMTEDE